MADILMIAVYMLIPALFALVGGIYLGLRLADKRQKQLEMKQAEVKKALQEIGE